jgi:hypothetical protein
VCLVGKRAPDRPSADERELDVGLSLAADEVHDAEDVMREVGLNEQPGARIDLR